jgi:hypothetical protein
LRIEGQTAEVALSRDVIRHLPFPLRLLVRQKDSSFARFFFGARATISANIKFGRGFFPEASFFLAYNDFHVISNLNPRAFKNLFGQPQPLVVPHFCILITIFAPLVNVYIRASLGVK